MKPLLCLLATAIFLHTTQAQVAISTDASAPHASAMLDVKSTTKGALLPRMTYSQRTGIGSPAAGLLVYQNEDNTTPRGFYVFDGLAWQRVAKAEDLGGGGAWSLSASNHLFSTNPGNVGIGLSTPAYKLDVAGSIHSLHDTYVGGFLGIGTTNPLYKLQVTDGSMAIHNSSDLKTWYFNYSSSGNYFQLSEAGTSRIVVANGGNVGIGTTTPSAKLEVAGNTEISGKLTVTGNAVVNNNKGVLYNAANANNLRYYTRDASFTVVNLAPHGISPEGAIGFSGFTEAPDVIVGEIVSTGGTTGQLWKCQLIIYDVTATGCKCRISNTSNTTINQDITWKIIAIGR